MRLLNSCGCDTRREIMFDKGNVGVAEGALVVVTLITIAVAWRLSK